MCFRAELLKVADFSTGLLTKSYINSAMLTRLYMKNSEREELKCISVKK